MTVTIRRLWPNDLDLMRGLNALFAEVFEDPQAYAAEPPSDGWLEETLAKPGVVALVALDGKAVVGGLVAYEFDKLERARREIYIYDLAVRESLRRQGVATALISRVCEIAKDRGAWAVYVQADCGDEPAIALYTKLGRREDVMHFDIDMATRADRGARLLPPVRLRFAASLVEHDQAERESADRHDEQ